MNQDRWVTLKDGRRVYISTNKYMTDRIRNSKLKKDEKNQTISQEEKNRRMIENQNEYHRLEAEREERIKKLMEDYDKGKINDEKYEKESLKAMNDFQEKTKGLSLHTIYDEKTGNYIVVEKSDIFYDKDKDYLTKINQPETGSYTETEKESIYSYTTSYGAGSSYTVNSFLYGKNAYSPELTQKHIGNIDTAMSKSRIGGEFQLYRSVEPEYVGNGEYEDVIKKINRAYKKGGAKNVEKLKVELDTIKGKTIDNKGFLSTSTFIDKNYAQRGVTYVINTKPDDRAIDVRRISAYNGGRNNFMNAFAKGSVQTESEILYDRNTKLKVKDVAITNEGIFLLCDTEQKKKK